MKTAFVLVAVLAFAACALAQVPCCTPDAWETYTVGFDPQAQARIFNKIWYDYANHRSRIDVHGEAKDHPIQFTSIARFDTGKLYIIQNGACTYRDLSGQMDRICVPNNSSFMHSITFGETLKAHVFKYEDSSRLQDISVTVDKCIPVTDVYVSQRTGVVVQEYIDFVEREPHPSVFEPPSLCKPAMVGSHRLASLMPAWHAED